MLGGMMIHGLLPGNDLFTAQADVIYPVMCGVFFANLFFLIIGVTCAKYFAYISRVPVYMLAPAIVVLCVVGAFAINNSMIDVYIIILFGALGFFFNRYEFDVTPMVLGLILGPIGEGGLARAIQINQGVMNFLNNFTKYVDKMEATEQLEAAQEALKKAEKEKKNADSDLAKLQKATEKDRAKVADLQKDIEKWQKNISDAEKDIKDLNSKIDKATDGKLPDAEKRVQEAEKAVSEAQAIVEKYRQLAE